MKKNAGIALIVLGVILMIVNWFTGLVDYNWMQLLAIVAVIGGIVVHIIQNKKVDEE